MKLKRFVAIVISLAMVLSIVPAFSLTASAESVTVNGMLPAGAVKVFDGGAGGKSIVGTPSGDTYIQNVYGDTWSSNWTGGGEGTNCINVITSNDRTQTQYAVQTYDRAGAEMWVKTTAGYGSDSDWFAFEYISTAGNVAKDIALLGYNPNTGAEVIIDQFRSGNGGEAVGFFPAGSSRYTAVGTLTGSENIANTGYVDWGIYRIFVEKGEGTYTVSYYHSSFANRDVSFTYLGTKTYSGDITGVGFGGLQIYNISAGVWYNNMRFWEPVVWADGVAEGNEAVAVDMKSYTQSGSAIVSGTISVAGKSNYLERVNGTTYGGGTPGELGSARYAQLKFDVPNLDIKKVTLKTKVVRVHNYLAQGQWMKLGVYQGAVTPSGSNTNYVLSEEKVYGAGNANTVYNAYLHTDVTDYITKGTENTLTISVPYSAFSIESTPQLIVEYTPAATTKSVTVTLTAGGEAVKTVSGVYDTSTQEGLEIEAFTYYVNGGNYIYTSEAMTVAESTTIAMTPLTNNGPYSIGDSVTYGGKKYSVTGTNLIPNGDFSQGATGWYNGTGAAASFFSSNGDGTMTLTAGNTGQGGTNSLYRAWKIEPGKTYVFTYTSSGGGEWHKSSIGSSFNTAAADGSTFLWGDNSNNYSAAGTNTKVFTATSDQNYVIVSFRWLGTSDTFGNFGLYEVEEVIETTADTVKAGMDSISLPLATKTSITVPTTSTDAYGYESTISWTSSNADVLAANGTVTAPSDITIVTLTPSTTYNGSTVTGDAHTVYVFPQSVAGTEYNSGSGYYDIGTENIISANGTDASFEDASGNQSLTGWLAHTGAQTNSAMNWGDATVDVVPDGNWAYVGWWNDNITGSNYCTLDTMWPVEAGTYYLSFYAKKPAGGSTTYVYFSEDNAHHTAVDQLTSEAWYELVNPTSEWVKYEYIITADEAGYIGFTSYNIGNNGSRGTWFDDFELYTAVQAAEDLVSVTNPADITVIAGNEPVLPKTVTGVGERGSAMTVDVAWNDADFGSEGTVTVTGTAAGMSVSVDVVVLPETFAMSDVTAYAGQNTAAIHYFPASVSGSATFEFDVVFHKLVNSTITIGDAASNSGNCPIFGGTGDAISIQTNTNGVNIRSWTDGSADRNVTTPVVTGTTYRFLITTDTDSDTWTAYMTAPDGTKTQVADGHGYRKVVDKLDSLTVLDNNSSSDTITVSNFRVNASTLSNTVTKYTVKFSGVTRADEYAYANADEIALLPTNAYIPSYVVPYIDGYVFDDYTLSGTTYTLTYKANTNSIGTWFTRNNVQSGDMLISDMNMLGAHDAFTYKMTQTVDPAACFAGDAGAKGLNFASVNISYAQAQDASAATLLQSGVRYFDVRLTMSDASESSVPATLGSKTKAGTNGEVYTTHGYMSQPFRTILYTIRDFCENNPGEVIVLDFQEIYNSIGDLTGGHDNSSWDKTAALLYEVLDDYLVDGHSWGANGAGTITWNSATNNGNRAAVICIGKPGSANTQSGLFLLGGDRTGTADSTDYDSNSNIYSYYTDSFSSYSAMVSDISGNQMNYAATPNKRFTVMQAIYGEFGGSSNLCNNGANVAANLIDESNFNTWIQTTKIVMMDNADENATAYCELFAEYNRDTYAKTYNQSSNGVTMTTAAGAGTNVPLSSAFEVQSGDASAVGTLTIDGVEYTPVTAYTVALKQYDTTSVQPTGTVTVTFPKASADDTTVDVLLNADGTTVYMVAEVGAAISIDTTGLENVMIATMTAPSVEYTVVYVTTDGETLYTDGPRQFLIGQDAYNFAASDRAYVELGGKGYIVSNEAQSKSIVAGDAGGSSTVTFTLIERYAALEDMLVDPDNNVWGIDATNENSVFVAAAATDRRGPLADADGTAVRGSADPSTLGSSRTGYVQFPVVSLADGEAAIANFYVRTWHGNTFSNGNESIRISATAINDDSWTTLSNGAVYTDLSAPQFTGYTKAMFSNAATNNVGYIQIDVTDMMKAAEAAGLSTITMRLATGWGAAYIAEREACIAGGAYEGNAAFIDVVEGYTLSVAGATQVTKMGTVVDDMTSIVVPAGETIKIYNETEGVVAYTDGTQVYAVNAIFAPEASGDLTPAVLGLAPIDGAQVRIGYGVDRDGKVGSESGLRFITTVNYTDSLANVAGAEMGVEITAEGSSAAAVKIVAEQFQNADKTVYTSALTNLAEGNFNRKFTATPYVTVDGQTFYGTPVARSIYQVAAGLLVNTSYDNTEYDQSALDSTVLYKVLNAYVNQTGIRLSVTSDGLTAYTGTGTSAYSGDQFFEVVSSETTGTNVYAITIKPAGAKTTINDYWQEYIRINNNNSKIAAYTSLVENEDGSVTITFDYASYLEAQAQ